AAYAAPAASALLKRRRLTPLTGASERDAGDSRSCDMVVTSGLVVRLRRWRPSWRRVLPCIVGQQPESRSIGANHCNVAVRLRIVRVQRHLVAERGLAGGEGYPVAVRRPRRMCVVAGDSRDPAQPRTVGLDRVDLPIAIFSIAGKRNLIA